MIKLYGSSISYFTGKLENYFRVKGIPYQFEPLTHPHTAKVIRQQVGSSQMPAVKLSDGRWLTDTTAIIQWFERQYPENPIIPANPVVRFLSLLLEDYADEWLWRPAMHYRWYYKKGARFASTHLAEEVAKDRGIPLWIKRQMLIFRQRNGYTVGDGISESQVSGVESIYLRTLNQLQTIFSQRPFLLGNMPSLADIGFSGPMFRHFALDPVPAEIMRQRAPAVYEWTARLWNSAVPKQDNDTKIEASVNTVRDDWGPILNEIGSHYLPYLCANVDAVETKTKRFNATIAGVTYKGARWSPYRVWCLAQLREHYQKLSESDQSLVKAILEKHNCWEPMWRHKELPLSEQICRQLPFHADAKMIDVYQ